MLKEVDWGEILAKMGIGLFLAFIIGMSMYAMQSMTPKEQMDFIMLLQQEQLQE